MNETQQNNNCTLYGEWDETVNDINNECSKLMQKKYKAWQDRKGDLLGIVQKIKIWSFYQMVYAQTRIRPKNEMHKSSVILRLKQIR